MTGVAIKSAIPAARSLRQELKPVGDSKFQTLRAVSQRKRRSEFNAHHSEINTWRGCAQRDRQTGEKGKGRGSKHKEKP